ncbi:MAG TPA: hypothetical protein VK923_14130 [Euzebyales bacterium]|nr:hypothetical protein [Euzebyales bacterium]
MVVALLVLVSVLSACRGVVPGPVEHAERVPPTHRTFPPPSRSSQARDDPEPFIAGDFDDALVGEASGVAAIVRNPGWVYVLDDGPGTDGVVAVDTLDGGTVRIVVEGIEGRDPEGLAVAARYRQDRAARPTIALAATTVGNLETGGAAGAGVVVLRTYDHVVAYTPPLPDAPPDMLADSSAREVPGLPGLPQPEGVAVDGCGLWLVSERVDSVWLALWTPASSDEVEEQTCPSGDGRS